MFGFSFYEVLFAGIMLGIILGIISVWIMSKYESEIEE